MAKPKEITSNEVIAEVRKLAEERPDHIYQSENGNGVCLYNAEGETEACIFGQALQRLRFAVPKHKEGSSIISVLDTLGIRIVESWHADWMIFVQREQDMRIRWATAVSHADQIYHAKKRTEVHFKTD